MRKLFALLLSITTISLYAQTGPAGVGNSTNNYLWLDATDFQFTNSNNDQISTWSDKSGNGNNFTQGSLSLQPRYYNYTFPTIRFDGVNDYMLRGSMTGANSNTQTRIIVSQTTATGFIFTSAFSEHNSLLETWSGGGEFKSRVFNSSNLARVVSNLQTGNPQIWAFAWDGQNTNQITGYSDNNNSGTTGTAQNTASGNWRNVLGARTNYSNNYSGDIYEIINYNKVLNSAERNLVDNYLSTKYNITITNDFYTYDAGYGYELFGIGQEVDGSNLAAQGTGIVEFSNASALSNGSYLLSGHNNGSLTLTNNDVPATIAGGSRVRRIWRADVTGTVGTVDVTVDVTSLTLTSGQYYLLVESNNGVFNDGGVVSYGPFADIGGLVTFSGVTLSAGDYYSIASGAQNNIFSVKTGYWDVASTWSCSCVPGASDNAIVMAGHTVTTRSVESIQNIIVDGLLRTDAIQGFDVYGDYTINGNALHKVVSFVGSSLQTITNNSANTIDFRNLVINNSNNVSIASGNFEVLNSVKVTTGQLQNNGGVFTFLSSSTRTAVIQPGASNAFSGQFVIERYVSTRNANWADLSSPVQTQTLGEWDSDPTGTITELFMSDVNGIDGRVGNPGSFYSVYSYDENSQVYVPVTDTFVVLDVARGYEIWLGDDMNTFNAKAFDSRGTPNSGNIAIPVANTFNLVGNPYQAWISWGSLNKPTLLNTYYIYNTNTGNFDAKTSGSIPPHQGFWVESVGAGTLTFSESSKLYISSSTFWRTTGDEIAYPSIDDEEFMNVGEEPYVFSEVKLKVSSEINTYSHELKLRMNNLATINHDYHDGTYLPSKLLEAPSIYSYSANNNKKLVINSFNYSDEVVLPIAVEVGISGNYIIEAINFEKLVHEYKLMELTDTKTGKVYDLTSINEVEVLIDEYETGERFSLRLSNQVTNTVNGMDQQIAIYKSNEVTVIEFDDVEQNYVVSVYNALGQKIIEDQMVSNTNRFELPNSSIDKGLVIIKVSSNKGEIVQKLTY